MNPSSPLPVEGQTPASNLTLGKIVSVIWESAVTALVQTFLFLILGKIALNIVGGVWQDMLPSLPPTVAESPATQSQTHATLGNTLWTAMGTARFFVPFSIFLVLIARARLMRLTGHPRAASSRGRKKRWPSSGDWFGLIVLNAFVAVAGATALMWAGKFSWVQIIWESFGREILPGIQSASNRILGTARTETVQAWFGWYGQNQLKFTFWLLYLAAICDDLGMPNIKTLGRRLWRRVRRTNKPRKSLEKGTEGAGQGSA